ncbi:DUF6366 family protein [Bacillus paranthracis]
MNGSYEERVTGRKRERIRQSELKNNSTGSLHDGLNRAETGSPVDMAGGMNWKGTAIVILVLVLAYIIYTYFLVKKCMLKL